MISNLNGSGSVQVHQKKRFLPVRGSGSVRLPDNNSVNDIIMLKYHNHCLDMQEPKGYRRAAERG